MDKFSAVVAGHICLDMIPNLAALGQGQFDELFQPGHLIVAGAATFSPGGPVPNTGLALHRLGVPARLMACVGADPFGEIIRQIIASYDPSLAEGIVTNPQSTTSYTVVIDPPGTDRFFLHCPGTNDVFGADDIDYGLVAQAGVFHFGYPPIMRRMYSEGGAGLVEVFQRARAAGVTTSLDMTFPDPTSPGGRADWAAILRDVLPYVDIFEPSIEELMFMLRRSTFEAMAQADGTRGFLPQVTPGLLSDVSGELLELGVKMAVIKLGSRGLYLRTAGRVCLAQMGRAAPADPQAWAEQELWAPCFQVQEAGTTGAGDATIAGFLSALLRDLPPRQAVIAAVAVGACNVEAVDTISGIRPWEETLERVAAGWLQHPLILDAPGWRRDETCGVWAKDF